MRDDKGIFYYPVLGHKNLRMYVRLTEKEVEFRAFDDNDPNLWDEHGWVPYSAILDAKRLHTEEGRKGTFPAHLYDIEIAIRLLRDAIEDELE